MTNMQKLPQLMRVSLVHQTDQGQMESHSKGGFAICGLRQAFRPFGELSRIVEEGLLDYLPGLRDKCCGDDGMCVYIEPDAGTIEHGRDLLRNVVSQSDNRSLTHNALQKGPCFLNEVPAVLPYIVSLA